MPHGGTPSGNSDDDGNSATRLVLCLDRLPARIPHAGSDKGPTRARRFVSPRAPSETAHWSCRASLLARSTRSAFVPADATSIANSRDSRNPRFEVAKFVPVPRLAARGAAQPLVPRSRDDSAAESSRRITIVSRRVSSTIRVEALRCSSASGSSSSSCASVWRAVSVLFMAWCTA